MKITLERVYDHTTPPAKGHRVLVDRLWPRGTSRDALALDEWCRDVAPSAELRKWFGHDPARWEEFRRQYTAELQTQQENLNRLRAIATKQNLVLLFGAKDAAHNQAIVLRDVLLKG